MPFESKWFRKDEYGLARYVHDAARHLLGWRESSYDAAQSAESRLALIGRLYEAFRAAGIQYAAEEYAPDDEVQVIRTPAEVLRGGEGTCLDLVLCFAGVAMGYDLLPVVVVLDGHAVLAISTTAGRRQWRDSAPRYLAFPDGRTDDPAVMRGLIDSGQFVAIECTGFAKSATLDDGAWPESRGRVDGTMSFERAVAAGREQLDARAFRFALNVPIAQFQGGMSPYAFAGLESTLGGLTSYLRSDAAVEIDEKTSYFVGRVHIVDEIDRALNDPAFRSGYVVVRGEPGIGKTALASWLVHQRGYLHHFNRSAGRARTAADFLSNVCAQIILRYALPYPALPAHALESSSFLVQLLGEAVGVAGDNVIVVVDALDEAEVTREDAAANRLFLPVVLPPRAYVVVTTREEDDARLVVTSRRDVQIREDDPRNLSDIREYVRRYVDREQEALRPRLDDWKVDVEAFAEAVTRASEGNFMYVVYVMQDIRDGKITPDTLADIGALPVGLRAYYQRHWRMMQADVGGAFHDVHELVIGILGVAQEPVSVEQIAEWIERAPGQVAAVIRDWRQFLNEQRDGGPPRFRLYHASFRDFLRTELHLPALHERIASHALAKQRGS